MKVLVTYLTVYRWKGRAGRPPQPSVTHVCAIKPQHEATRGLLNKKQPAACFLRSHFHQYASPASLATSCLPPPICLIQCGI